MPGWDFYGNAVISDDFVRLTPDRQAKEGMLWNHEVSQGDVAVCCLFFATETLVDGLDEPEATL